MILTDFSKIKFGSADITAVYAGAVKLWPAASEPATTFIQTEKTQGAIDSGITVGMEMWATGYTEDGATEALTYKQDGSGSGITYDDGFGYIFPKKYKSIDFQIYNDNGTVAAQNLIKKIKKIGNVGQVQKMGIYSFKDNDGYAENERLESIDFQDVPVEKIEGIPSPLLWKTPNLRNEIRMYASSENLDTVHAAAMSSNAERKNDGHVSIYYDTTSATGLTVQANAVLWTTTDSSVPSMTSTDASGNTVESYCYIDRGVSDLDVWQYVNRVIEGNVKSIDGFSNKYNVYKVIAGLQLGTEANPMATLEHINFSWCSFGTASKSYLTAESFKHITANSFTLNVQHTQYIEHLKTALTEAGWNMEENNDIITATR